MRRFFDNEYDRHMVGVNTKRKPEDGDEVFALARDWSRGEACESVLDAIVEGCRLMQRSGADNRTAARGSPCSDQSIETFRVILDSADPCCLGEDFNRDRCPWLTPDPLFKSFKIFGLKSVKAGA